MKKVLALLLVFGMASLANATIVLSVDGDTTVSAVTLSESESVLIDIHSDDGTAYGAWLGIADSSTDGEWVGNMSKYAAAGGDASYYSYGAYWWKVSASGTPTSGVVTAGKHFEIEFRCASGEPANTVVIKLMNNASSSELDRVTVSQIPEPMTIGLLGLGGLFLRRRR